MRIYLSRTGAPVTRIRSLISRFRERGYLNDEAYALRWASARLSRRPMGRTRLEAELLWQGLDRGTASRAVEQVYRGHNEWDLARTLLGRRPELNTKRNRERRAALLRRHGFDDEIIEQLLPAHDGS